ncbi:MAG: hypothetical protein ACOYXN_01995 [Acidobacteriota bacterium]
MPFDLFIRGVFEAGSKDGPLEFRDRLERVKEFLPRDFPLHGSSLSPEVFAAACLTAACGGQEQSVMGLLDGRGGLWILEDFAMPYLLGACLDRVAEESGREPGGEPMLLIVGLPNTIPPDQAERLVRLTVRAACQAAGARHPLRFMTASLCDTRLDFHALSEEDVAALLNVPDPDASFCNVRGEGN